MFEARTLINKLRDAGVSHEMAAQEAEFEEIEDAAVSFVGTDYYIQIDGQGSRPRYILSKQGQDDPDDEDTYWVQELGTYETVAALVATLEKLVSLQA